MLTNIGVFLTKLGVILKQYLVIIVLLIILGAGWQGWTVYKKFKNDQIVEKVTEDEAHKAALLLLDKELAALKEEKARLAKVNTALAAEVAEWQKKANDNKPPAPVKDPPKEVAELIKQISTAGVPFVLVAKPNETTFKTVQMEPGKLQNPWSRASL